MVMNFGPSLRSQVASDVAKAQEAAWNQMVHKASNDGAYRARLVADPVTTMRQEGIEIPAGVQVTMIEWGAEHAYLFLPPLRQPAGTRG